MGYALDQITSLPFGNIIGAPLRAAIEAQSVASKATVDFIQTVGFKPKDPETDPFAFKENEEEKDADMGDLRYVTFLYQVKGADGIETDASLRVPVLTIVPIPFLRIDEMTIDFMAKITEELSFALKQTSEMATVTSTSVTAKANWWWASVSAGLSTHLCFGNFKGRAAAPRRYAPMFPAFLELPVDEMHFEMASREFAELELIKPVADRMDVAVGVIDVKSYYIETPEDVAARVRDCLRLVPAERLVLAPDCGLSQTARWASRKKLKSLVDGVRIVRRELGFE